MTGQAALDATLQKRVDTLGIPQFEQAGEPLHLTGLLKPLIRALSTSDAGADQASGGGDGDEPESATGGIPVLGFILFCMEGINFEHGVRMAQLFDALHGAGKDTQSAIEASDQAAAAKWRVPPTWNMPLARPDAAIY